MDNFYRLGHDAALQVRHAVRQVAKWENTQVANFHPATGIPTYAYAQITGYDVDGKHDAIQVVFDGTSWVDAEWLTWGSDADDIGYLQEIHGDEVDSDTVVLVFSSGATDDSDELWFFLGPSDDKLVKVSSNDTTAGYVEDKLTVLDPDGDPDNIAAADTPLGLSTLNEGGDEEHLIAFDINDLTAVTELSASALFIISQGVAQRSRKITRDNLITQIELYLSGTSDDIDQDLFSGLDASTNNIIKFTARNLELNHTNGLTMSASASSTGGSSITSDGTWIQIEDGHISHIIPAQGGSEDWVTQVVSKDGGGTYTNYYDNNGHLQKYDTTDAPGGGTKYKYVNCDDGSDILWDADDLGAFIEVAGKCYQQYGPYQTSHADDDPTVVDVYASCAACATGKVNYAWLKCSDDSAAAIFSEGNQPADSFAWVYTGSVYEKCYYSHMTAAAATDPCFVESVGSAWAECAAINVDGFSDSFADATEYACKQTETLAANGAISGEGSGKITLSFSGEASYNSAKITTRIALPGDFTVEVDYANLDADYVADHSYWIVYAIITIGATNYWVAVMEAASESAFNGTGYYNSGWTQYDSSTPASATLKITRSGTTLTMYRDATLVATITGVGTGDATAKFGFDGRQRVVDGTATVDFTETRIA